MLFFHHATLSTLAWYMLSSCLSVWLSVTNQYFTKMAKYRYNQKFHISHCFQDIITLTVYINCL